MFLFIYWKTKKMINHILVIARKEIFQLIRDKRMLFVLFFFPVFLLMVFGYAINFDVDNITLSVYDQDKSELSKDLISALTSSNYFKIVEVINDDNQIKELLDNQVTQAVIVIPKNFEANAYSNLESANIQMLVDGVNGNTALIIMKYFEAATQKFNFNFQKNLLNKYGKKIFLPVDMKPIFWFNPDLKTTKFLLPGLISMILIITTVISMSLSIVREKEKGTIEQLNVSKISTIELLIGKSIPYAIISIIDAVFILAAGFILFGVAIEGSMILLSFSTLIYIIASLSLGILISVIADSQQVAFTISTFATMLPATILSGFIFPIESMPTLVQIITNITPAKFFNVVLRDIILKGVGITYFWDQLLYLCIFAFIFLALATKIRNKRVV